MKNRFSDVHCSLARALDKMGDWWTPLIVRDLFLQIDRFDDLIEDLGISRNLLTTRLRELEAGGIIERHPYSQSPRRHSYRLTRAGRELVPILVALTKWGDEWAAGDDGPPVRFRHQVCDHDLELEIRCAHCDTAITCDNLQVLAGPGGREAKGTRIIARRLAAASFA